MAGEEPCQKKQRMSYVFREYFRVMESGEMRYIHPVSGKWDWVTLSPKKFKPCLPESYAIADELKVVVFHRSDMDWAAGHAEQVPDGCALYLQPEWDRREDATFWILSWIASRPGWRISLQTHKYIGIR